MLVYSFVRHSYLSLHLSSILMVLPQADWHGFMYTFNKSTVKANKGNKNQNKNQNKIKTKKAKQRNKTLSCEVITNTKSIPFYILSFFLIFISNNFIIYLYIYIYSSSSV